jgi:hypothetical protein
VCFDFLYNFSPQHFSFSEELSGMLSKMNIGRHVKYRNSCQIPMNLEFSGQLSNKYSKVKFETTSSGSRVVPKARKDRRKDGRTDGSTATFLVTVP